MRVSVWLLAQAATVPAAHFQIAGRTGYFANQVHSALVTGQEWKAAEGDCHPSPPQLFDADPGGKTRTGAPEPRGRKTSAVSGGYTNDLTSNNVQDKVAARGSFPASQK